MKQRALQTGLAALLALAAGCFSMDAAPMRLRTLAGAPVEHVVIANNGWYLFNAWPLACGNAHEEATFRWRLFRDDVSVDILQDRLTRYAARRGCDVAELNVFNDEQVLLSIPGTSFPLPLPYILTFREAQLSCVLMQRPAAGGAR